MRPKHHVERGLAPPADCRDKLRVVLAGVRVATDRLERLLHHVPPRVAPVASERTTPSLEIRLRQAVPPEQDRQCMTTYDTPQANCRAAARRA